MTIAAVLTIALVVACSGNVETVVPPTVVPSTPIPTIVSTPFRLPLPSPTPTTNLGRGAAEIVVWRQIADCADQVSTASDSAARLDFNSVFHMEDGSWMVDASSQNLGLSFGRWKVVDATEAVAPISELARAIASPGVVCGRPEALLSVGLTPPRISTPPEVSHFTKDIERAELLVWERISSCVNQVTVSSGSTGEVKFITEFAEDLGIWTVEASSLGLNLGIWEVDDTTMEVTPIDVVSDALSSADVICEEPVALLASGLTPPIIAVPDPNSESLIEPVTGEQASLKIWAAVRSCFAALPSLDSFTAYAESSQRWLVVGTGEGGINYGMWLVDVTSGGITPHDTQAKTTARNNACFVEP